MAKCDVALLLYSDTDDGHNRQSQQHGQETTATTYIQPIYQRLQAEFPSIPCIVAKTKGDLSEPSNKASQPTTPIPLPTNFTSKNKHVTHTIISTKTARPTKLFEDLVMVAVGQQEKNIVGGLAVWKRRVGFGITITVVVGGLVFAGRLLWKAWHK
jgi:hypothetical protein